MTVITISDSDTIRQAVKVADQILDLALIDSDERRAAQQFAKTLAAYLAIEPGIVAIEQTVSHTALFAPKDYSRSRRQADIIRAIITRNLGDIELPNNSQQAFCLSVALLNNRPL
jgi:hypothetical protein